MLNKSQLRRQWERNEEFGSDTDAANIKENIFYKRNNQGIYLVSFKKVWGCRGTNLAVIVL